MSWFNKHSVQAFFYNKIWVIRRAGEARRSLCVLLLCTMSSFWLWFVMICHHLRDCATCDSNRDNMTAGCWPLWCACFSSKFTDPYKEKPGLHPDSTTGWKSSNFSFGYCEWKRDASFIFPASISSGHEIFMACVSHLMVLVACRCSFTAEQAFYGAKIWRKNLQVHCVVFLYCWKFSKSTVLLHCMCGQK